MTEIVHGIEYSKPTVILLQETGIGTAEAAARTCYDSFEASENDAIKEMLKYEEDSQMLPSDIDNINAIEHSDLLDQLAWTHFHHSILEHANLTYLIKGTSRGVLQEHARHRIQAISVRSTRYTMQNILHAFNACSVSLLANAKRDFTEMLLDMNIFVVARQVQILEIHQLYDKLHYQLMELGKEEFANITMSKSAKEVYNVRLEPHKTPREVFDLLCKCTSKRNVGDAFKWAVTDNWKVDMVVTFNLRSLKNYLTLRDSGAAYFGIRWLAQAIRDVTPSKYLNLVVKV